MASSILSPRSKASLNASEMDAKLRETAAAEGLLEKMQHGLASAKSPALGAGGANKGPWTKEEDEMLIQLVNECGTKQWSVVASHLKVRRAAPLPALLQPGSLLLLARTGPDRQTVPGAVDQQPGPDHQEGEPGPPHALGCRTPWPHPATLP